MELSRDRRAICAAIGNKNCRVASLHPKPEHPPTRFTSRPSGPDAAASYWKCLYSGRSSRRFGERRIGRDRKKHYRCQAFGHKFLNKNGCRTQGNLSLSCTMTRRSSRRIRRPGRRGTSGDHANLNVRRKGRVHVGSGIRGDCVASVLIQDDKHLVYVHPTVQDPRSRPQQ